MGATVGSAVAIGLMSGTSLDGVDVALIETDGEKITRFGPTGYHPYADAERVLLRSALAAAVSLADRASREGVVAEAEEFVTQVHAEATQRFLELNRIDRGAIDIVGFHGQTILHRPDAGLTVQIGDGFKLAQQTGVPVVFDFRAADVAAGGQGAPLVPVFHRALVRDLGRSGPVAVLNIGGVANITYVDGSYDPVACDTGPGNALIDDFIRSRTGEPFDRDGAHAAAGRIDQDFVAGVLDDPFFAAACPKSLDRNAFAYAGQQLLALSVADAAATLTALTAATVARIVPHLPQAPRSWIVAGGGSRNRTLLRMLADRLAPASIETAGDIGWSADALEAQAFAYLAARRLRGLPISFPTTTGVARPLTGGVLASPDGRAGIGAPALP